MTNPCEHAEIVTYLFADTRKASGLWACKSCQTKFVPIDLEQEKDATRYRWLRDKCQDEDVRAFFSFYDESYIDHSMSFEVGND